MNIFVTDVCPEISARTQCDKHVVKMVLESAQMLSTAWRICAPEEAERRQLYKAAYMKHPCTQWVQQSAKNYRWLYDHFLALCDEYSHRYEKTHSCARLLSALDDIPYRASYCSDWGSKGIKLTPFAQAMPDQYKNDCAYTAYRDYLVAEKSHFAKWEKDPSRKPTWWNN